MCIRDSHGLRHGVFTYYLLRGLKGAANANSDQIVTIRELYTYVHTKVREYTTNVQTPVLTGAFDDAMPCLLYTSPSPRDRTRSRMPSSA